MADEPKTYTQEQFEAMVAERDAVRANRDEILRESKKVKEAARAFDGLDPERSRAAIAALEDMERKKATAEGDFTKLRDQLVERHTGELAGKDKRIGKLEGALNRRLTSDELRSALAGKALPEYMDLLVEHGAKFVQMHENDDDFGYLVTDGKGNPAYADGKGTPMTVGAFVDQVLKDRFPGAFQGTGSTGGGAPKSAAGGGGRTPRTIAASDIAKYAKEVASGEVEVVYNP